MFRHAKKWFVRSRTIGRAFAIICGYEASNISIARMLLMGVADIYEALWDEQAK